MLKTKSLSFVEFKCHWDTISYMQCIQCYQEGIPKKMTIKVLLKQILNSSEFFIWHNFHHKITCFNVRWFCACGIGIFANIWKFIEIIRKIVEFAIICTHFIDAATLAHQNPNHLQQWLFFMNGSTFLLKTSITKLSYSDIGELGTESICLGFKLWCIHMSRV